MLATTFVTITHQNASFNLKKLSCIGPKLVKQNSANKITAMISHGEPAQNCKAKLSVNLPKGCDQQCNSSSESLWGYRSFLRSPLARRSQSICTPFTFILTNWKSQKLPYSIENATDKSAISSTQNAWWKISKQNWLLCSSTPAMT